MGESIEESEKRLIAKRKRDRIADLIVVIALLGVTAYNSMLVRKCNVEYVQECDKRCQEIILGIAKQPEWLDQMGSNHSLQESVDKLKNFSGVN